MKVYIVTVFNATEFKIELVTFKSAEAIALVEELQKAGKRTVGMSSHEIANMDGMTLALMDACDEAHHELFLAYKDEAGNAKAYCAGVQSKAKDVQGKLNNLAALGVLARTILNAK